MSDHIMRDGLDYYRSGTDPDLRARLAEVEAERDEARKCQEPAGWEAALREQTKAYEATARAEAAEAALARCREVLRRVGFYKDAPTVCQECGGWPGFRDDCPDGHMPDCALKAALGE